MVDLGMTRVSIVDTGCSGDTHSWELAKSAFLWKIRKLLKAVTFNTAALPIKCTEGARVQLGPWDVPLDVQLR